MSERDVVFNLKTSADPRAVTAAKEFEQMLIGSQKRVFKSAEDFDRERVRIAKATKEALVKFAEEHRDAIIKDAELARSGMIRINQMAATELNRVDAAQLASEKAARAKHRAEVRRDQQVAAAKEEADLKASLQKRLADFKASKRQEEQILKDSLRRRADDERAAEKLGVQMKAMNARLLAEEERRIASNRAAIGSQGRMSPVGSAGQSQGMLQVREQFSEMGESIMRVTRGITMLGLVGEKDIGKVRDALLTAQSAFDIFGGSLKIVNKLEKAWDGYRKMILAATVAQVAHGAASNATSLASLGSGVASLFSSGAKVAPVVAGGLGIGSYMGGGAAAAGGAGLAALAAPIAAAVAAVGGSLLGLVGTIGTVRAAMESGIGGGAKAGSWTEWLGTGSYNPFANLVSNETTNSGAYARDSAGRIINARNEATKSTKDLANAEKGLQFRQARNANIDEAMGVELGKRGDASGKLESLNSSASAARVAAARSSLDLTVQTLGVESKIASIRNRMNTATTTAAKVYLASQLAAQEIVLQQLGANKEIADNAAKISEINAQRAAEEQKVYSIRKKMATLGNEDKPLRDSMRSEMEGSANKMIALTQQRGEIEKAIAQTRASSARASLDSARKELDTVTSRIKSEHDALKTAEERFGLMSRADQQEVMQLLAKARAGKQLDAGQVSKLKSLGTQEAERLASAQARNLANGDYTQESQTLAVLDEQKRRLNQTIRDKMWGKTNKYGVNLGPQRMHSKQDKKEMEAASYAIEVNERRAEQIRIAVARDTAMRRSIFGEERGQLAQSLNQRQSIEARISQQLTVVARFDNTAKQVADQAVRQLMEAQAPWVQEFERRLNETMQNVGYLQNQRRQMAPGRT